MYIRCICIWMPLRGDIYNLSCDQSAGFRSMCKWFIVSKSSKLERRQCSDRMTQWPAFQMSNSLQRRGGDASTVSLTAKKCVVCVPRLSSRHDTPHADVIVTEHCTMGTCSPAVFINSAAASKSLFDWSVHRHGWSPHQVVAAAGLAPRL